jgi:hypothetical protein
MLVFLSSLSVYSALVCAHARSVGTVKTTTLPLIALLFVVALTSPAWAAASAPRADWGSASALGPLWSGASQLLTVLGPGLRPGTDQATGNTVPKITFQILHDAVAYGDGATAPYAGCEGDVTLNDKCKVVVRLYAVGMLEVNAYSDFFALPGGAASAFARLYAKAYFGTIQVVINLSASVLGPNIPWSSQATRVVNVNDMLSETDTKDRGTYKYGLVVGQLENGTAAERGCSGLVYNHGSPGATSSEVLFRDPSTYGIWCTFELIKL